MHSQPSRKSQASERNGSTKCSRHWTAPQLQRKRQLDRESQRVSREKTKNRISYLEGLVKSFQENDDDRVKELMKKIDDQAAEIQKLRDVIRGINRLIEGSSIASELTVSVPESNSVSNSVQGSELPMTGHEDTQSNIEDSPREYTELAYDAGDIESVVVLPMDESVIFEDIALPSAQDHSSNQESYTIAQLSASIAEDHSLDGRLWYLAGGVLSYLLQARDIESSFSTCDDEDIAIRAVFEGWSAVTERYQLDSGWQWLKELDERIYQHLPAHNRLVHMRNTRLVLVNQVCPNPNTRKQIPPCFTTQSFESHIQYDRLVEHFPWPGFRRRVSFSPFKFATNKFVDALRTYFDFTWNQHAQELYARNPLDGRYQYSDSLVRRMMDIRCYTAKREFFQAFPELRSDIPCSAVSLYSLLPLAEENSVQADNEMLLHDDGQKYSL